MKISYILFLASFVSAAFQPLAHGQDMEITAVGMNSDGQFVIAQPGDLLTNTPPQIEPDWDASSGLGKVLNKPTLPTLLSQLTNDAGFITSASIPSVARTVSSLTLSLVGAGATGTQVSATKSSSVRCNVSTSTTSTIGGASSSVVALKKCATNSATEGNWTTVATLQNDQTISLAIILQSIQVIKGQLTTDLDPAWYVKLVASGSGTHTEAYISTEQTIYG